MNKLLLGSNEVTEEEGTEGGGRGKEEERRDPLPF